MRTPFGSLVGRPKKAVESRMQSLHNASPASMTPPLEKFNIAAKILVLVWIALLGVHQYYYVWNLVMHSDMASDLVHGQYIAEQGHLLFANGWYNSSELKTLSHHDFILAAVFRLTDQWRVVWIVGCMLAFLGLAVSAYCCAKRLRFTNLQCVGIVLLYLLPTTLTGQWTILFPTYLVSFTQSVAFLWFYMDLRERKAGAAGRLELCAFCLFSFVLGTGGIRIPLMTIVPTAAAEVWFWIQKNQDEPAFPFSVLRQRALDFFLHCRAILLGSVSMLLGLAFLKKVLEPRYGTGHVMSLRYRPERFIDSLRLVPIRLLSLLGTSPVGYDGWVLSKKGLFITIQYCIAAVAICALACYAFRLIRRRAHDQKSFASLILMLSGLITCFVLCLTDMGDSGGLTERYFASGFWGLPFLVFALADELPKLSVKRAVGSGMLILTILISGLWCVSDIKTGMDYLEPGHITFLRESNYTYGAATFWNANVTIVKTEGKIEMKSILNDEELTFYAWLQKKEHELTAPQFLLLTCGEYEARVEEGYRDPGPVVYKDDDYVILDLCA